jgi:hypothetical protein
LKGSPLAEFLIFHFMDLSKVSGTLHFCKILKLEIVLPIGEETPLSLFLDSHTQPQASALGQALKSRKGLKLGSLPYT